MDFFTDLFSQLSNRDSLLVLLFLFIAFAIGLITGWLHWRRSLESLQTDLRDARTRMLSLEKDLVDRDQSLKDMTTDRERLATSLEHCKAELKTCQGNRGQLTADLNAARALLAQEAATEAETSSAQDAFSAALGGKVTRADSADKDDLKRIGGVGPFIEIKLNELGIYTFEQISQLDDDLVEKVNTAIAFFPGRIARDNWVGQAAALYQTKLNNPEALMHTAIPNPSDPNDLKIIEGIGPKIEQLLKNNGIHTWSDLANSSNDRIQTILNSAGETFRIHDPSTWPKQAALATKGDWDDFRAYTDFLSAGRDPA